MTARAATPDRTRLERLCARDGELVPNVMLVLAHPDDETVGAASLLPRLLRPTLVYVTDGAPRDLSDAWAAGCPDRESYAAMRRGELMSALESVGIGPDRVEFIDCVDQEASQQLAALARWMEILIREHRPALVLTHPYEGGHPDHDATAFAVHAGCRRIATTGATAPAIAEFTSYHANHADWTFGEFLPAEPDPIVRLLRPNERALKRRLIGCYATQTGVLHRVPLDVERFRMAPEYDFRTPPHPGELLYERFNWGIAGQAWRRLAQAALAELPELANAEFAAKD